MGCFTMIQLFTGIDDEGMKQLAGCMRMRVARYKAGEKIAELAGRIEKLGLFIEGRGHLELLDEDGTCTRVEEYREGDVFGELFFLPREDSFCSVEADEDCRVMFLDWGHIVRPCPQSCIYHARLISNLFQLAAEKSRQLSAYTDLLTKRSLRQKLLTYFESLRRECGRDTFILPMSLSSLAEYLCVDRSAMMRELKSMRDDGLLISQKRQITLLRRGHGGRDVF